MSAAAWSSGSSAQKVANFWRKLEIEMAPAPAAGVGRSGTVADQWSGATASGVSGVCVVVGAGSGESLGMAVFGGVAACRMDVAAVMRDSVDSRCCCRRFCGGGGVAIRRQSRLGDRCSFVDEVGQSFSSCRSRLPTPRTGTTAAS